MIQSAEPRDANRSRKIRLRRFSLEAPLRGEAGRLHKSDTPQLFWSGYEPRLSRRRRRCEGRLGLIRFTVGLKLLVIHRLAGVFLDAAFSLVGSPYVLDPSLVPPSRRRGARPPMFLEPGSFLSLVIATG